MIPNASDLFWNEVQKKFENLKDKFDLYLKKMPIKIQNKKLKYWIDQINTFFNNYDMLKGDNYSGIFNLDSIYVFYLNMTEYDCLKETKKFGYKFDAITSEDFQQCLREDTSCLNNLKYQVIIAVLANLTEYFNEKLIKKITLPIKNTRVYWGFKSTLNENQVQSLFNQLKGEYIAENTNIDDFRSIFGHHKLQDNKIITWIENPILLAYLIFTLKKDGKIKCKNFWVIGMKFFYPHGKLRQLAYEFQNSKSGKPKGYEKMDIILKSIYTS